MTVTARSIRKWRNKGWSTGEVLEYFGLTKLYEKGTKDDQWNLNSIANVLGEVIQEAKTDLRHYQRPHHFDRFDERDCRLTKKK
jgi:hypothetical protein